MIRKKLLDKKMNSRLPFICLGILFLLGSCVSNRAVIDIPSSTLEPAHRTEATERIPLTTTPVVDETPASTIGVHALLDLLLSEEQEEKDLALQQILASDDARFIAVLIELMRAAQIGLIPLTDYPAVVDVLETLSDQTFGRDWPAWIEWYGGSELSPPPGFTSWKGRLLSRIDPRFAGFLQDEFPSQIRVEEIQWGGVLVDGIPALNNPEMIPAEKAEYLDLGEPVFGIALNGDARAYPLRIMDWHEMANDVVGGVPVSLAYCTLCGAGIAFDGRAPDGNTYTFGSSGFLYRSNKLMYDRETSSLWNQLTGEPVLGELADEDLRLSLLPLVLTSWSDWLAQHPDTQVLSLNTGYERPYELGAAYGDYFSYEETMFPVWQRSDELPAKARIYALYLHGLPKAYALERLVEEQVVNDTLGETSIVLVAEHGTVEVEGFNQRAGQVNYDSGGEVRVYDRGEHSFSPGPQPGTLLDEQGNPWQVTEEKMIGPDGQLADRISGHLAYWFGWFAFFPNTLVYK